MQKSRELVEACYRRLLDREPESDNAVDRYLHDDRDGWAIIRDFAQSDEFKTKSGHSSAHSVLKTRNPRYLMNGLSEKTRFACFIYNLRFLLDALKLDIFHKLIGDGVPVLTCAEDDAALEVRAQIFGSSMEGEIVLSLIFNGQAISTLSSTIVPAAVFEMPGDATILISRVQGRPGTGEQTRRATRMMGDITPSHVLFQALEGIATAHGIPSLIGINAQSQPSYKPEHATHFVKSYDALFTSLGAKPLPSGLYLMKLPRESRPLSAIPIGHRARTRIKRARKREILDASTERWTSYLATAADDPIMLDGTSLRHPAQDRRSRIQRFRSIFA